MIVFLEIADTDKVFSLMGKTLSVSGVSSGLKSLT